MFRLITHSTLPEAQRFEKWLFEVCLPQIRRTGSYNGDNSQLDAMTKRLAMLEQEVRSDKLKEQTYTRMLARAQGEIRRYKERLIMTDESRYEIFRLTAAGYPVSHIARITKKGAARIKKTLAEIDAMTDEELAAMDKRLGFTGGAE